MRAGMATIGMLVGLTLLFSSCGGGGSGGGSGVAEGTRGEASDARARAVAGKAARGSRCRRRLGAFISAMASLRDKLARGLSYEQYLGEVKGTRVVYARIQPPTVPAGCLLASGGPGERAFNLYIDAANAWGDCLATASCETRAIEPELQRRWMRASRQLSLAQAGLRR